ncbi:hypothetical protein BpHYR1_008314 [Brachionus plicatilis]|uniref:Uncharacterized protein n=1 Tax=Brachionus plicatilis TaxID=10195 RepID=A0A3M7PTZ8_BRAPC|nr:hypothetical protein BpHYR1_008314 [Brachionus plicatilis]
MKCSLLILFIVSARSQSLLPTEMGNLKSHDLFDYAFYPDDYQNFFSSYENSVSVESFESFESISEEFTTESESFEDEISIFRPFFLKESSKKTNANLKNGAYQRISSLRFRPFRSSYSHCEPYDYFCYYYHYFMKK